MFAVSDVWLITETSRLDGDSGRNREETQTMLRSPHGGGQTRTRSNEDEVDGRTREETTQILVLLLSKLNLDVIHRDCNRWLQPYMYIRVLFDSLAYVVLDFISIVFLYFSSVRIVCLLVCSFFFTLSHAPAQI